MLTDNSLVELKNVPVTISNDEAKIYHNSKTSDNNGKVFDVIDLPYLIDLPSSYVVSMKKTGYYPKSKTVKVKRTDGDTVYVDLITRKAESTSFHRKDIGESGKAC